VLLGLGRSQLDELIRSGRLQTGQTDTSPDLSRGNRRLRVAVDDGG
jgi:hypothetical protein